MGSGPAISILVLTLVHFAAFVLLFWHLAGREIFSTFRIPPNDEGPGGSELTPPPDPSGDRDGGLPLPDATPAPEPLPAPERAPTPSH